MKLTTLTLAVILLCSCADPPKDRDAAIDVSNGDVQVCSGVECFRGVCVTRDGASSCLCEAGWNGASCDRCDVFFHDEGGSCIPDLPCSNTTCWHGQCVTGEEGDGCICDVGYAGDQCEVCATGYRSDGLVCLEDSLVTCAAAPCVEANKGVCLPDAETGHVCVCDPGTFDDGGTCVAVGGPCDPNPCSETLRLNCQLDASPAGYTCACNPGLVDNGGACVDDPCLSAVCDQPHRGTCVTLVPSFLCICDPGYIESGSDCVLDPNASPCNPNPCLELNKTVCTTVGNTAQCDCDAGFVDDGGACVLGCDAGTALCAAAHRSIDFLVSTNGFSAIVYDVNQNKAASFFEHLYRNWDDGVWTRDFLFDTYLGIRTSSTNQWLNTLPSEREETLEQTGIIHVVHRVGAFEVDTYVYAPFQLSRPALTLLGKVTNRGTATSDVSLYTLHNYHLGYTSVGDPVHPDALTEAMTYDAASHAYVEQGVGGMFLHQPLGVPTHYGATPDNPWVALNAGQNLADTQSTAVGDDRVAGFQKDFSLAPGEAGWFGVVSAFDAGGNQAALAADVAAAYSGMTADTALQAALDEWEAWRVAPPAGLSAVETQIWRQSEAVLRMGQVRETSDLSFGQILASLPPGNWNITWSRDMAYAVVGLVHSGHAAEAMAALEFVLKADSGGYEAGYTGVPYQVSITRYFGRGREETDFNADGPNIEYDGFGLYLWALGEYVRVTGDNSLVTSYWSVIRDQIASALVTLVDASTGLLEADSSIWEVHWNGQQKQFTYTALAAARGLCEAAAFATSQGDTANAATYLTAGQNLRDAVKNSCVDNTSVLASSLQELQAGTGYHDMATVEAFNWLLLDPTGTVATATFDMYESALRVATGRGYFRNDDGGAYDSQEWVFVDLRASIANRRAGRTATADALVDWVSAQALVNYNLIAELFDKNNSDCDGSIPMVGFGAGAYIIALHERENPSANAPFCGGW
ncbi:MAG: hypothetical protein AUK47_09425 [Deltaproteobacteria bacterium CG2_30_63_29]|nr:MAG: hypothetical protein AUK47_09425 [Deltaproteobacteria bacterium CG2_30_63_29]